MTARCPVCGNDIRPESIPIVRSAAFECSRCRWRLCVKPAVNSLPMLLVSLLIAALLAAGTHFRGISFGAAVIGLTLAVNYVARFVRNAIQAPKLQRVRSRPTVPVVKRAHVWH